MEIYLLNVILVVYLTLNNNKKFNLAYALSKIVPEDASDRVIGAITLIAVLFPLAGLLMVLATYYSKDDNDNNEINCSSN